MADQPAAAAVPARLPKGWDRATRVREVAAALQCATTGSNGHTPAPGHQIIPEAGSAGGGYRCGTCLLPIAPAWAAGPEWRHAGDRP